MTLEPCPFCGGKAKHTYCEDWAEVRCIKCEAVITLAAYADKDYQKNQVVKLWNTRTTPSAEQADDCIIKEAFNTGKKVGEIAGEGAVEALEKVRYQRDRIERAYKQLLSETSRESGWQPIETAPRDVLGGWFLLSNKKSQAICEWYKDHSDGRYYFRNVWSHDEYFPTHWRPLPKPSEEKA